MQEFRLTFTEQNIDKVANEFLDITRGYFHFAFYGEMAVGKTTLIKAICHCLGTDSLVSSPTFAIVNEYMTFQEVPVYHFDFYRIKTAVELLDIGFHEYCSTEGYCFIEWPEKGEDILPDDFIKMELKEISEGLRELSFSI